MCNETPPVGLLIFIVQNYMVTLNIQTMCTGVRPVAKPKIFKGGAKFSELNLHFKTKVSSSA